MIPSQEYWDGNASLPVVITDGGRQETGRKGSARDCVARSISIAGNLPYDEVYAVLAKGTGEQRASKRTGKKAASARNGVYTKRKWFKDQMAAWGFEWTPCMLVGQGCKVHLLKGELPSGRLVVAVSKHYTAVIDGVIHDTFDPQWQTIFTEGGKQRMSHRCVYGYWRKV